MEFEGDTPNTSLRIFMRGDHISFQYLDEIETDAPPAIVTLPNLPPWENKPDIVCRREVETEAFDPKDMAISPSFD